MWFKHTFDEHVGKGEIEIMRNVYVGRAGELAPSYDVYRVVVDGVYNELTRALAKVDDEFERIGVVPDVTVVK